MSLLALLCGEGSALTMSMVYKQSNFVVFRRNSGRETDGIGKIENHGIITHHE